MSSFSVARAAAMLLMLAATSSCGSDSDDGGPRVAASIVIIPNHPTVLQGQTRQLQATVVDAAGRAMIDQSVTYESSDPSIATVSTRGLVTSEGPLGTVVITVAQGDLTGTVDLAVQQRAVTLEVGPQPLLLNTTEVFHLMVRAIDVEGNEMYLDGIQVTSSNPAVVATNGIELTAGNAAGTARITVTFGGLTEQLDVTVGIIPMEIRFNQEQLILAPGGSQQLAATVIDRLGNPIPSPSLTWSGTNNAVFTVSSTGMVTSVGPNGGGRVRVQSGTLSRDIGVYVGPTLTRTVASNLPQGGSPYAIAVGPGGQMLLSLAGSNEARRGDFPAYTFPTTITLGAGQPLGVALNSSASLGYVGLPNGIDVINMGTNLVTAHITLPRQVYSLLFSSDGARIFAGTEGMIYSISSSTRDVLDSLQTFTTLEMARHPTQARIYATNGGEVWEINATTLDKIRSLTLPGLSSARGLAVAPDGQELYVADEGSNFHVVSLTSGVTTQRVATGGCFGTVVSGPLVVAACGERVRFIDRSSMVILASVEVGGVLRRPALTANGTVVVANESGSVAFVQ